MTRPYSSVGLSFIVWYNFLLTLDEGLISSTEKTFKWGNKDPSWLHVSEG